MREQFSLTLRVISTIVLSFFIWTFCLFETAYAISNSSQQSVVSSQGKNKNNQNLSAISHELSANKPENKFQKTIENIESILVDTVSDTNTKKGKLKNKKTEIESLDVEIKKQFKETEAKIKDLPEVIKKRHADFVQTYDKNLNELKNNLDAIDKAKDKAETDTAIGKAKAHLEKVRPPKRHQKLDPNKLPHSVPEIKTFERKGRQLGQQKAEETNIVYKPILIASNGSLTGLLSTAAVLPSNIPTSYDLSETIEIQLTSEIRAKAQELGHNPVKIYEFVRNSVTFEPYFGSLKGAQQTLAELAGNDMDQASLLIALLRAANIPSRYVCGTIELPMDRLANWIGVKDSNTAATILATNGIPGTLITEGGAIKYAQFEHCWVEAYVDMFPSMGAVHKQGDSWIPIDPSFKEMQMSDSINISKTVPFDETTYINTADDMPPVLSYIYKLKDYYNTNYDYNFTKIFHLAVNKRQEFGIFMGTLPYEVMSQQKYSEIPNGKRHKISIQITTEIGDTAYIEKTYPEIAGKKLTITYTAATAEDQAVINSRGGLLHTPAYLVRVKPELKLDDVTILTGPEMGLGFGITLTAGISSPNLVRDSRTADISRGISYAIGLPALTFPGTQLVDQIDRMRVLEGTLYDSINAMDTRAGELLQNIAIEYFGQLNNTSRSIEGVMHVQLTKMPSIALVSADAIYEYIFGMPISPPIMGGLGIDAIRVASSPMPIDGDLAQRKEFIKHRGLTSSYLEHKILENLLGIESISAVKVLQLAAKNGIPIYTINSGNIASLLPLLTLSSNDKEDIQNAVNAGKEVMVSRDNVTLYDLTGVGYIVRDPKIGTGSYMISNNLGGGGTVKASNPAFKNEIRQAIFVTGNELAWNEWLEFIEADIQVWWWANITTWKGYLTICALGVNRDMFIYYANQKPWIFYYMGHGGWDDKKPIDTRIWITPQKGEFVYPKDIDSDCKIVFLNGCGLSRNGDFAARFHVDQDHNGEHRSEAFLSWDNDIYPISTARTVAGDFWEYLRNGDSVATAVIKINDFVQPYNQAHGYPSVILKYTPGSGGTTRLNDE